MIFKPYYYFETGCALYLLGGGGLRKCAVVDAQERDVDAYAGFDTHVHADHLSGDRSLAKKVGASYCLQESADVAFPFERLRDPQEIELGRRREGFIDALVDVPPKPLEMERLLRANQGRGES